MQEDEETHTAALAATHRTGDSPALTVHISS